MLDVFEGVGAGENHFAHVGDIKEARLLAHRHVLLDDAGAVLHRQQVACEGDNLAALFHMDVVKWGFPFHCAYSFPVSRLVFRV